MPEPAAALTGADFRDGGWRGSGVRCERVAKWIRVEPLLKTELRDDDDEAVRAYAGRCLPLSLPYLPVVR